MSILTSLDIATLAAGYRRGELEPVRVVRELLARRDRHADHGIWITPLPDDALIARAEQLRRRDPASLPLYGIPFAIKDNIDLAGWPTTAGCPAFAYTPTESAQVVQRLLDAGAIAIGKANLDQFATGLVGTRSPYGVCRNSFDQAYVSGGSSSGSAVAVALGLASFALGTDTAGSGRVPAAFNNLVGWKPSCGALSTRGMVPACRSLDAMSVFALTAEDAMRVARVAQAYDAEDAGSRHAPSPAQGGWSRKPAFRFGVPRPGQREFFGNADYASLYEASIERLQALGGVPVTIDLTPFLETARLLYEGPWVAERYLAAEALLTSMPDAMLPVTRQIIGAGSVPHATEAFRAQYRLAALKRDTARTWQDLDLLLLPTAGSIHRIDEDLADPIRLNARLGHYTNFVNLLDLAAVAVPAGFTPRGLPFGVTLIAPAWQDADLLALASRLQRAGIDRAGATGLPLPADPDFDFATGDATIDVAVCGAHLSGLPLNHQLTSRGAWLKEATRTAARYRLHALPDGPPLRPGLVPVASDGMAIDVEVWSVPSAQFGSFVAGIPAPLGIGKLLLEDATQVCGFLCESVALAGAPDISEFGGWRAYLASR
jgi:allophanate hydrolase